MRKGYTNSTAYWETLNSLFVDMRIEFQWQHVSFGYYMPAVI